MERRRQQWILCLVAVLGLVICAALGVYGYQLGIFTSQATLRSFISGFGALGILVFIVYQAVQVVIPMLPGAIGCVGGVLMFGPWKGFAYNYIGICLGCLLAFGVARAFGRPLLHRLFSERQLKKYENWTAEHGRFSKLFALAILMPVAPDDFLCYLAGTTAMTWRRFVAIVLLGKPAALAAYSVGLTVMMEKVTAFFH